MTAITIDKDKAIELLEKQVEKKGADYVYPYSNCVYFADEQMYDQDYNPVDVEEGTPLCILGNVYADLGLTVDDLLVNDGGRHGEEHWVPGQGGSIGESECDVLPDPNKVTITGAAMDVLGAAQSAQDHRNTWGEALKAAKAVYN